MKTEEIQIDFFKENGFLLIEDLISSEELSLIDKQIPLVISGDSPRIVRESNGEIRSVYGLHQTNIVFERLCRLDKIIILAKQILGSGVYVHQTKINIKKAFSGEWWEWHQDYPYWNLYDGMPSDNVLSVMIFLDEVNDFNGPLYVIPGSHKIGIVDFENEQKDSDVMAANTDFTDSLSANLEFTINQKVITKWYDQKGIFAAKGKPGTCIIFHGNIFHASNCNLSPIDRKVFIITYNSVSNTPGEVQNQRPDYLCSRDFKPLNVVFNF